MLTAATDARAGEHQVGKFRYDRASGAAILVCSGTVAPADCDIHSALETLVGLPSPMELGCGVRGGELLMGSGVAAREGQYVKVACPRDAAQSN
jgi:hypothetical protein